MNKSMNKNKVIFGILFVGIAAGLIYNQIQPANQAQQGKEDTSALSSTLVGSSNNEGLVDSALLTATPSNTVNNSGQNTKGNSDAIHSLDSSASSEISARVVVNKHQQPADHRSAQQPKPHGHENQRRHPENNSLIPPGEPKKPLPTQESKG
ncbi:MULTISPECIES: hypothetical protein [Colwellia]|uniref:Uncharacterized protein n=1 Tax=Colwellia marinimaniae TaxID=1513592 RepID=A0ABQ0MQB0_9GAMM|nr:MULTISPECIES: hypothetical protein [Colwellia]GAW94551.1 hypothetical protein MTCD1_00147 [Colwellia marinimaniae]